MKRHEPDRADDMRDGPSMSQMSQLSDAVRWVLDDRADSALASADWIAREIDPQCASAIALVSDARTRLERLVAAKDAFKTMRIVGETPADRRAGARLYAATIAAALVHHGERITTQSGQALARAFEALAADGEAPAEIRALACRAIDLLAA